MSETNINQKINIRLLICRTCLKIRKDLYNIYEHIKNDKLISDILMECLTIEVQKDDGLPKNICNICLEKLNMVSDFRTMVIASDMRLHNFYNNPFQEPELQESIIEQTCDKNTAIQNIEHVLSEENDLKENTGCNSDSFNSNNHEYSDVINILEKKNSTVGKEEENEANRIGIQQLEMVHNDECNKEDDINHVKSESETKNDEQNKLEDIFEDTNTVDSYTSKFSNNSNDSGSNSDGSIKDQEDENKKISLVDQNISEDSSVIKKENENSLVKIENILKPDDVKANLNYKEKRYATLFCQACKKTFSYHYYFSIHLPQHLGQLPFKCESCGKSFPKKSLLNTHEKSHSEDKPYTCEVCGKTFKYMGALRTHGILHVDIYPYKCNMCTRMFKHVYSLQVHLLRHSGEKPVICDVCGKSFINQADMNKHAVVHGNDRSFPCEICGKFYKSKRSLGYHRKKHLDLKPYECNYCSKRFHTKTILQHHISIHTGAKPYACTVCGKTFRQKNCIGRHMRLHTGETPYACEICPSKFKYSHLLVNHMKIHK